MLLPAPTFATNVQSFLAVVLALTGAKIVGEANCLAFISAWSAPHELLRHRGALQLLDSQGILFVLGRLRSGPF